MAQPVAARRGGAQLVLALVPAMALSGCHTPDAARLSAQVAQQAPAGAPLAIAVQRLVSEGFRCDASRQAQGIDCSRSRQGALLYTCMERVILQPDASGTAVAALEIAPIACAGL